MRLLWIKSIITAALLLLGTQGMADEFKCVHEQDTAPPLDPVADGWFQQARTISKERLPDWAKVAQLYQKAVEKDHWKAMHNLAELYLRGKGVAKDTNEAIDLYLKMIKLNVPLGYYDMSVMTQRGVGVVQSHKDAVLFLLRAADLGSPRAQTHLGNIYIYDLNKDKLGVSYLRCAAKQDFPEANYELAMYYELLDRNYPVAMHYYQRAVALGHSTSALVIEGVFRQGKFGYEKDEVLAEDYRNVYRKIEKNPDARFPSLAVDHPLPPHPIQGYHADKDIKWKPTGRSDDY